MTAAEKFAEDMKQSIECHAKRGPSMKEIRDKQAALAAEQAELILQALDNRKWIKRCKPNSRNYRYRTFRDLVLINRIKELHQQLQHLCTLVLRKKRITK